MVLLYLISSCKASPSLLERTKDELSGNENKLLNKLFNIVVKARAKNGKFSKFLVDLNII